MTHITLHQTLGRNMAQQPDTSKHAEWRIKAANKRSAELAKIPSDWRLAPEYLKGDETSDLNVLDVPAKSGILSAAELKITQDYSAVALAKAVQSAGQSRHWT